jgi:hypothetical protein
VAPGKIDADSAASVIANSGSAAFVMRLDPQTRAAERAAYDASYKGVTDILTLYHGAGFLPDPLGGADVMTPNMVTASAQPVRGPPSSCS